MIERIRDAWTCLRHKNTLATCYARGLADGIRVARVFAAGQNVAKVQLGLKTVADKPGSEGMN